MIELYLTKGGISYLLDMEKNTDIKYQKFAQELAQVDKVGSAFSIDFNIPKTPRNVKLFNLLSMVGDVSKSPYKRAKCDLYYSGHKVVTNAQFILSSSEEYYYKGYVRATTVDFISGIKQIQLDKDIDFTELDHSKNLETVFNSHLRDLPYCYILADYNGDMAYIANGKEVININYLIPSVKVSYVWDKIFEKLGFTYKGSFFETEEFKNSFITFPTTTTQTVDANNLYISDENEKDKPLEKEQKEKNRYYFKYSENSVVKGIYLDNRNTYSVPVSGEYTMDFNHTLYGEYRDGFRKPLQNTDFPRPYSTTAEVKEVELLVNGNLVDVFTKDKTSIKFKVNKGNKLSLVLRILDAYSNPLILQFPIPLGEIKGTYNLSLTQNTVDEVKGSTFFGKMSALDFMVELFRRFAIIPFETEDPNCVEFLTYDERLNYPKFVNLSHAYVKRESERYSYETYAKSNRYKHKYNDQSADYNDGFILVDNENLEPKRTLYESKFYTYNKEQSEYSVFRGQPIVPMWDIELKVEQLKDSPKKELTYSYKALTDRHYFIKRKQSQDNLELGDPQIINGNTVAYGGTSIGFNGFYVLDIDQTDYKTIIAEKYQSISKILSDCRIHFIHLDLGKMEYDSMDLRDIYYFEQEKTYYILSKLNYDIEYGKATGEFVRLKTKED